MQALLIKMLDVSELRQSIINKLKMQYFISNYIVYILKSPSDKDNQKQKSSNSSNEFFIFLPQLTQPGQLPLRLRLCLLLGPPTAVRTVQ